jgi:hypothetical protein
MKPVDHFLSSVMVLSSGDETEAINTAIFNTERVDMWMKGRHLCSQKIQVHKVQYMYR